MPSKGQQGADSYEARRERLLAELEAVQDVSLNGGIFSLEHPIVGIAVFVALVAWAGFVVPNCSVSESLQWAAQTQPAHQAREPISKSNAEFGDSMAPVAALVSALALIMAIRAMRLQQRELALTRAEAKRGRIAHLLNALSVEEAAESAAKSLELQHQSNKLRADEVSIRSMDLLLRDYTVLTQLRVEATRLKEQLSGLPTLAVARTVDFQASVARVSTARMEHLLQLPLYRCPSEAYQRLIRAVDTVAEIRRIADTTTDVSRISHALRERERAVDSLHEAISELEDAAARLNEMAPNGKRAGDEN